MQQIPLSHDVPYSPPVVPPGKSRKRTWLVVAAAAMALLAVTTAILLVTGRTNPAIAPGSSPQPLTLYYRDGTTVLWTSGKDMGWMDGNVPGFAGLVIDELKHTVGYERLTQGKWQVTTTLDRTLQQAAEQQLQAHRQRFAAQRADSAAMAAQDITNGQIVSWAGGLEATAAEAQDMITREIEVGTLALPFTYAALIENTPGTTAATPLNDTKGPLPGYPCTNPARPSVGGDCLYNFDYLFAGQVTLRQALGSLRLVPAVAATAQLIGQASNTAKLQTFTEKLTSDGKFSCYSDEPQNTEREVCYTAAVFGDGLFATPKDIIEAYATLANGGKLLPQTGLLKASVDGQPQYDWRQPQAKQAMQPGTARTINSILADRSASFLPSSINPFDINGTPVSVAMGMEPGAKVFSTVHFSSKYAVGLWAVGSDQGIVGASAPVVLPPVQQWLSVAH